MSGGGARPAAGRAADCFVYGKTVEEWLRFQSAACGRLGSALYERILAAAAADFEDGGPTRRLLAEHRNDPGPSALVLRMLGSVHRLVLEGGAPELAERYRIAAEASGPTDRAGAEADWSAFRTTLADNADRLARLILRPVQTNEVGRCAGLLPGFLEVAASTGLPLRLLEVGASGGLNLRWSNYRFEAGDFAWGPPSSPVRLCFDLLGSPPAAREARVASVAGCDPAPVDPATEEGRLTLLSYVWPDQGERMSRLCGALDLAAREPIAVERAAAAGWVAERLAEPVPGVATVVFHSVVMQYLPDAERAEFERVVAEAGATASAEAPLAWLRMEPDGDRAAVRMTVWPGGEERLLARAGYHGNPVELRVG